MIRRGLTIPEQRWPETPDFVELARTWQIDASTKLLDFIWQGLALYKTEVTDQIDITQAAEEIERTITQSVELKIRRAMSGFEPFSIQHGSYEYETRREAPAQPPEYDLAYVWHANERIMWPIEAKVLKTERNVAPYANEITENYLTCRYAPFSSEGVMLGYLFSGNPNSVFSNISNRLNCELHIHSSFTSKDQRYSSHIRDVPEGKAYPKNFCCHHLIFNIGLENLTEKSH